MKENSPFNVHATALVIGTRGLLLTGPSGSGKSSLALALLQQTASFGASGTLISDDQVLVERQGDRMMAIRPEAIAGLLEIRGSGIVRLRSIEKAPLHLAIRVLSGSDEERLPPEGEVLDLGPAGALPMVRMRHDHPAPLIVLAALRPDFCQESPFQQFGLLDF